MTYVIKATFTEKKEETMTSHCDCLRGLKVKSTLNHTVSLEAESPTSLIYNCMEKWKKNLKFNLTFKVKQVPSCGCHVLEVSGL